MTIKPILAAIGIVCAALYIIPQAETATADCRITTSAAALSLEHTGSYKTSLNKKALDNLEDYIIGVVAAEMPASYNSEALMAQAIAARTYALRELEKNPSVPLTSIGQAYISQDTMRERWGESYRELYEKVRAAVSSTEGMIITYDNEPILAAFCASSGGVTEKSENVWGSALPYLTAVDSHWDSAADGFTQTKAYTEGELDSLLGGVPEIQAKSQSGYVLSARVGGKVLTGMQIRQKLSLKSAAFDVKHADGKIYITTRGYGHGVGMSQTGANGMAEEGNSCRQILAHYYPGTEISICG